MRDPNRIPEALALLARTWAHYPDLRLGQLLEAAVAHVRTITDSAGPNLFYAEDYLIVAGLRGLLLKAEPTA